MNNQHIIIIGIASMFAGGAVGLLVGRIQDALMRRRIKKLDEERESK